MKHWLALAFIVVIGTTAIVVSERRKVDAPASPNALLYLVADAEQELTRMPVHFTRVSDEEEIRVGNEIATNLSGMLERNSGPETTEIQNYVTQVGTRLVAHAHRKLPYSFHYIPERHLVNAFALPGGHVYIGAGLLEQMDSEDELAAVLGHELEHVEHYHCADRVQQQQALRKIPFGQLFAPPVEIFEAGYSKNQELESDREGTRLAVETGYSANGAIRLFQIFQRLFNEYHNQTKNPQEELSRVAMDALEGYFRSHPLPAERIAQINTMIASEGWTPHAERDLAVGYIFATTQAQEALSAGKFKQAQQLATKSLKMRPDSEKALRPLADAQFAQADFAGAAASYRKILDLSDGEAAVPNLYAISLVAENRETAAKEFRQWMAGVKGSDEKLQVPMDGLLILSGDPAPARKLRAELLEDVNDPSAPESLSELGWWWYVARDYPVAADVLHEAVQRRPGSVRARARLTWAEIETRRLADALQTIQNSYENDTERTDRSMASTVARWQAQERDEALREFQSAIASQPQWKNPKWVGALYSPLVVQIIQEMETELERRKTVTGTSK